MVDGETLFFGVHLYRPIYAMALKDSLPAVFVGTGWDIWDGCVFLTLSCSLGRLLMLWLQGDHVEV